MNLKIIKSHYNSIFKLLKYIVTLAFAVVLGNALYFIAIREAVMLLFSLGLFLVFLGITKRYLLSLTLSWAIPELIHRASSLQYEFTGEALSWQTLRAHSMYDVFITILHYPILISSIIEYGITCYVLLLASAYVDVSIKKTYLRMIAVTVGVLGLVSLYLVSSQDRNLTKYGNYGFIKYFIWSINNDNEKPYLLAVDKIETQDMEISCPSTKRNILIMMEESTFNPYINKDFAGYAPKEKGLEHFFHGNLLAAPVHVHVYGGGTYLSEFAFLTGIPHNSYNGFAEIVHSDRSNALDSFALPALVKKCGYKTLALFPETSTKIWRADAMHASIKTDELFFFQKQSLGSEWSKRSDEVIFNRLKQIIAQEQEGKPLLVYALTISQHGPYDSIEDYMRRLALSAKAFNDFGNSLGKDWVYGWFGDHQPHLGDYLTHERTADRHVTFSAFFTNDNNMVPFKGFDKNKPIDISFMSYLLTKNLGFKMQQLDPFYASAMNECQENFHSCSEKTKNNLYNAYLKYIIK